VKVVDALTKKHIASASFPEQEVPIMSKRKDGPTGPNRLVETYPASYFYG